MNKLLAPSLLLGLLAGATAQARTTPTKTQIKKDERRTKADDSEQPDVSRGGRGPGSCLAEMTNGLNLTSEQ